MRLRIFTPMEDNRMMAVLEKQLDLFAEREKVYLAQIDQLSLQLDRLSLLLEEQTKTIQSLETALLEKNKDISSLSGKNRGLAKLLKGNASEKITPVPRVPDAGENRPLKKTAPIPKERGNNNAKRKEHFCLEEQIVEVWPESEGFDPSKAHIISHVDSIRYTYLPCRFIKKIYRQYNCRIGQSVLSGAAPRAPFMNSSYDASFIAGLLQLRYIYSMPVERVVKLFHENNFPIHKSTAHALISKASLRLDSLYDVLRRAIHEDPYIRMDETYHNVLTTEKNGKGKGIRKGYLWSALAEHLQLVHFFYEEGSRQKAVFTGYLETTYQGAVHTDGLACYKEIEIGTYPHAIRLSCIQHAKRKFIEVGKDQQAEEIINRINQLYRIEHEIPPDWPPEKKLRERKKKAPLVLDKIKKKLIKIKNDPKTLPSTPLATATHYMLREWDTITNYLLNPDYTLDNNAIERVNRYISLSRRNSLFFGCHDAAKRAALLYSLACSCRLHGINVFEYFTNLLNKMAYSKPNTPYEQLRLLLPDRWKIQDTL